MLLSIVVPTYNRPLKLQRLLNALAPQIAAFEGKVEVVVVDDGGLDRSTQGFVKSQGEWVRLIRNESNLGPSEARNRGVMECKGEAVAFIDDDVLPSRSYLRQLLALLEESPHVKVAVGHLDALNGDIYARFWKECYDSVFCPDGVDAALYPVKMFSTGLGVIRREVLELESFQPPFAPALRTGEDYDLFQRLSARDIAVWKCDAILAFNETRTDLRGFLEQRYGYWKYGKARRSNPAAKVRYRLSFLSRCLSVLARAYTVQRAFREWLRR